MGNKNFWEVMNKGIKVNNNYVDRSYSPKEKRDSEINNHRDKEDIGGSSSNYKTK